MAIKSIKSTPKFQNGDEVKDTVTGLKGIIVATTSWLNGCIRYVIQPQELKDGKPVETTCIDEEQLELRKAIQPVEARRTGGGRDDSKAMSR
jgi:hypothetical protein